MELVKTNSPSIKLSLSDLAKKMPFSNFQISIDRGAQSGNVDSKLEHQDKTEAAKSSGIPSYFDLLRVKAEVKDDETIPRWKVKRKTISQESVDARTKHVVSAVAKAVSQSSLVMRLEDFCNHLFQYPQAKSLASRVMKELTTKI